MNQIIGFFGGDSQVGTTMIAWSFATRLAERGSRVLLLFGSGNDDRAFVPAGHGQSIDGLKAGLRSGRVDRQDLMESLEQKKNLWLLPGVRNPFKADEFLEDTFQILLDGLEDTFDFVVIDGGSSAQRGLTLSALQICTQRYIVITQQAKTIHRYMQWKKQFLEPQGFDGKLMLNQYRKDPSLFLKKDVSKLAESEIEAVIPYIEGAWQAEMEQKNLLAFSNFGKAIDRLVDTYVSKKKGEGLWKKSFSGSARQSDMHLNENGKKPMI